MYLKKIYEILLEYFGPQGWWHADSKFEVCVGIILVQRTTWHNAAKVIGNLRQENLITTTKITKINLRKLERILRPAGFYRQKAKYLKVFSRYCIEKYRGELNSWFAKPLEELRRELLQITGIGPETADSILLYAAEKPVFVIDVYTERILERIGVVNKNAELSEIKKLIEKEIPPDLKTYKELRALFVELGKKFCKTKPQCNSCPLESVCLKHIQG